MDEPALRVSVEGAWLVRLIGRLDSSTLAQLGDTIDRPGYVVIDCSELASMDRAGVAVLVAAAHRRPDEHRERLVIIGLTGAPLRVAQQAGLDDIAEVRP
jgi:anti-anti-sigma factor